VLSAFAPASYTAKNGQSSADAVTGTYGFTYATTVVESASATFFKERFSALTPA